MLFLLKRLYKNEENFRATIIIGVIAFLSFLLLTKMLPVLYPFFFALIISALLNPLVTILQKWGLSRGVSSAILIIVIIIFLLNLFILFSFFVQKYFVYYGKKINEVILFLSAWIPNAIQNIIEKLKLPFEVNYETIKEYLTNSLTMTSDIFVKYFFNIFNTAKSFLGIFSFLFILPILTFYILKDWNKLTEKVKEYTPPRLLNFIEFAVPRSKELLKLQLIGQFKVASIVFCMYTFCLFFIGIKPFFLLGIMSGFFTFIPFIGNFLSFLLALAAAVGQGLGLIYFILIMALYFVGSSIESNFLTPKLVGWEIGLHPVWIFFAVLTVLLFFGIGGAFFIMPLMTLIWSLIKSIIIWYKKENIGANF